MTSKRLKTYNDDVLMLLCALSAGKQDTNLPSVAMTFFQQM